MDYGRENVVQVINTSSENWSNDQAVWATEDDYRAWNNGELYDPRHEPPSKKPKSGSQGASAGAADSGRSKAIGKMFFKTKLCCKFRAGTCPYVTNCNFAHSVEELRRPPPNWQEIVAAHEEDASPPEPREEFQIPSIGFVAEAPRSYKGRHCKKFYTEEGCPYGESCTFLHDEQSKNRESVAISLGPGGGGGGGGSGGGGIGAGGGGAAPSASGVVNKPSNWKTRICNKWELTGYCPFGSKCHFAHGQTELHRYGGGLMENDGRDSASTPTESKQPPKVSETMAASVPLSDVYHIGVPSQRASMAIQRPGQRVHQKWKGPDKISRIYGDWIDDVE